MTSSSFRKRAAAKLFTGVIVFLLVLSSTFMISIPDASATFPGTNGKIAFASDRDGIAPDIFDIYTMNPDGTGVTRLTFTPTITERMPAFSADGTKIIYISNVDGGDFDVWVMNADGTGQIQLTFNSATDLSPHWSPDGTKIIFDSNLTGDYEIYVINADGTGQTPLTNNSVDDNAAAWSPDGTKIAFQRLAADYDIWLMNADGTGELQLTTNIERDVTVSWSPDTSALLFRSDVVGGSDIMRINPDGTGLVNLTNTFGQVETNPSYSPDGTKIVIASNLGNLPSNEIAVMNSDGTNITAITATGGGNADPDWGPQPVTYNFTGFFQPVDNLPTLNIVAAGKAIPVKFSLDGFQGFDIFAPGYPRSTEVSCGVTAGDAVEQTVTAGSSSLSYDASTDQYTYVWKTEKGWAGTCRTLVVKLKDGTYHQANFKFQ